MRILIVNRHIDDTAGGSETQCHEIATGLAARGHAVAYAACPARGAVPLRGDDERRTHEPARRTLPYRVHRLRGDFHSAFERVLEEATPDVIYWRYNKRALLRSVLAARRRSIKFVFAVSHINDVKVFAVKPFYARRLGLARRAARASGRLRSLLTGAVNYCALHLVDGVLFQHAGQIPAGFRRTHATIYNSAPCSDGTAAVEQPPRPYVLWVANLKQSKNPEEFLRLSSDLQHLDVEFWMVGDIQDPAYRPMLESGSLPCNFRYLGFKPPAAVDALIRNCLFVAHTCDPEGFPNVFIQAWVKGKAVVSLFFDPGALLKTHGIGICSGDYEAFKRDVVRLIEERETREQIAARALRFAAENCDRDRNIQQLEAVLSRLVEPSAA